MKPQITKVTDYIENHLDDELDVVTLAKVAGYSHFHFCRVFKLNVGESVMSYANRLRLERASTELTFGKKSMIDVALDAGFQTPTGFLKAFKARFGTTPTAYKKQSQKSINTYKDITMNTPEIIMREEAHVVFTRELGGYVKSSDTAWKRLSAAMNGLDKEFEKKPPSFEMELGKGNAEALGLCHDDPKTTNEEEIRYDAALVWGEAEVKELAKYGFETKTVAGGKYAMVSYQGDEKAAEKAWYGLYAWIEESSYNFRDEPAFEKYINALEETDTSKIQIEVYVPIA